MMKTLSPQKSRKESHSDVVLVQPAPLHARGVGDLHPAVGVLDLARGGHGLPSRQTPRSLSPPASRNLAAARRRWSSARAPIAWNSGALLSGSTQGSRT